MNSLRLIAGILLLVCSAHSGDVAVQVEITRNLTKKVLSAAVYNLRGTVPPSPASGLGLESEFDRTAVMLDGGSAAPKSPLTMVINQHDAHFEPDLVVVPVGSSIQFPNSDPIFHNVFSLSRAQPFDLGFYPRGKSRTIKFSHEGIVQVYCHIHADMYAAIVVTSSPWYGKPSADGAIRWSGVPAGHYRLMAWHSVAGMREKEVDVLAGGTTRLTIGVPVEREPKR